MDSNSLALGIFFVFISIVALKTAIQKYKTRASILPRTKRDANVSNITGKISKFSLIIYMILSSIFLIIGIILIIHGLGII